MKHWRHAVAVLVLALFVPASVLAGASFHHCVSDSHNAVEFVVPGLHHVQSHDGHDHGPRNELLDHDAGDLVEAMELVVCSDAPLLMEGKETPRADAVSPPTNNLSQKLQPDLGVHTPPYAPHAMPIRVSGPPNASPQLANLRTVILLI